MNFNHGGYTMTCLDIGSTPITSNYHSNSVGDEQGGVMFKNQKADVKVEEKDQNGMSASFNYKPLPFTDK